MGTVGNGCGWEYLQTTKMIHNENWYIGFCKKKLGSWEREETIAYE